MHNLFRYLRIYCALVRFSVSKAMEFRLDFFLRFFMDCVYYAVSIAFFKIIYLHTPELGGWREDQTLLFLAVALLLDGIYMTVLAHNMWNMTSLINKGELDYLLVRPTPTLFIPLLRNFEVASLMNVGVGALFFLYAVHNYQDDFTVANALMCFLLILIGIVMYTCLRLFAVLPVFWTHSPFGFHMLFESLASTMERPEVIFRGATHLILVTILPFVLITSFPARAFFGEFSIFDFLHVLVVLGFLLLTARTIWMLGLRAYSSASS